MFNNPGKVATHLNRHEIVVKFSKNWPEHEENTFHLMDHLILPYWNNTSCRFIRPYKSYN